MIELLVAFAAGFAIEVACVYWVHFSERGEAWATARCSLVIGVAQHTGIGDTHGRLAAAVYGLGMGAGTYVGVKLKGRRK